MTRLTHSGSLATELPPMVRRHHYH